MTIKQAKRHRPHKRRTLLSADRSEVMRIRNSRRMRTYSSWFRVNHPLCCDPFGEHATSGLTVSAQQMHHVVPLDRAPSLAFVITNCRSVCTACHSKLERKERAGQGTGHLFNKGTG